jgi:hypothetical protein
MRAVPGPIVPRLELEETEERMQICERIGDRRSGQSPAVQAVNARDGARDLGLSVADRLCRRGQSEVNARSRTRRKTGSRTYGLRR